MSGRWRKGGGVGVEGRGRWGTDTRGLTDKELGLGDEGSPAVGSWGEGLGGRRQRHLGLSYSSFYFLIQNTSTLSLASIFIVLVTCFYCSEKLSTQK
jgi:hypothetical protein